MSLMRITKKFINHLDSLERMLKYNEEIIKQHIEENAKHLNTAEIIDIIIQLKTEELKLENDEESSDEDFIKSIKKRIERESLTDFIYRNLFVYRENGEDIIIEPKSLVLKKVLNESLKSRELLNTDIGQFNYSIVISLVSSLELLIGDLLRFFILEIDQSDFLGNKSIKFNDLIGIGNIDEARYFLVEQYLEELLRKSFKTWIEELDKKGNLNLNKEDFFRNSNDIESVNETFQRRHLLVHNDGVVNDLYLSNVDESCAINIEKGEKLPVRSEYIQDKIKLFRRVGMVLIYSFSKKVHRKDKDQFFQAFNTHLLVLSEKKCVGARYIFKKVSNDITYEHSSQLLAKINYYLSFRFSGEFEKIEKEVFEFEVSTLSTEYKMAKSILLNNVQEAFIHFEEHVKDMDNDEFLHIIDWPLVILVKEENIFKEFIDNRMDIILENEDKGGLRGEKQNIAK